MLILVVGPSGAGKDTVLDAARKRLAGDSRFRFVRRAITRPASSGGEDHEAITEAEFDRRVTAGEFSIWWRAHGLGYGTPADVGGTIARNVVAVVNGSRTQIEIAAQLFPTRVIEVTAAPEILAQRLAARGREPAGDISERLARVIALPPNVPVDSVCNDSSIEVGVSRFVAALNRAVEFVARS